MLSCFFEKNTVLPGLTWWKIWWFCDLGYVKCLKGWPDFLSINSHQDDGDEPVEKNSLQIGMMGLSRFYAYKIYKKRVVV